MNRIDLTFRKLKKERRKAFIPYVTGGDPNLYVSKKIVDVLPGILIGVILGSFYSAHLATYLPLLVILTVVLLFAKFV